MNQTKIKLILGFLFSFVSGTMEKITYDDDDNNNNNNNNNVFEHKSNFTNVVSVVFSYILSLFGDSDYFYKNIILFLIIAIFIWICICNVEKKNYKIKSK